MNKRAVIIVFTAAITLWSGAGLAASVADGIMAQLSRQGFTAISSETTWLGRLRIIASRKDGSREIVINPRTGEILRDQFTALRGTDATQPILDEVGDSTDAGKSGSDDKGSGDTGSGSGSGGSGSGSGSGSDDSGADGPDDKDSGK